MGPLSVARAFVYEIILPDSHYCSQVKAKFLSFTYAEKQALYKLCSVHKVVFGPLDYSIRQNPESRICSNCLVHQLLTEIPHDEPTAAQQVAGNVLQNFLYSLDFPQFRNDCKNFSKAELEAFSDLMSHVQFLLEPYEDTAKGKAARATLRKPLIELSPEVESVRKLLFDFTSILYGTETPSSDSTLKHKSKKATSTNQKIHVATSDVHPSHQAKLDEFVAMNFVNHGIHMEMNTPNLKISLKSLSPAQLEAVCRLLSETKAMFKAFTNHYNGPETSQSREAPFSTGQNGNNADGGHSDGVYDPEEAAIDRLMKLALCEGDPVVHEQESDVYDPEEAAIDRFMKLAICEGDPVVHEQESDKLPKTGKNIVYGSVKAAGALSCKTCEKGKDGDPSEPKQGNTAEK